MAGAARYFLGVFAALGVAHCRSQATSIDLIMDTDIPQDRPIRLRVVAINGAVAPQDLPSTVVSRALMDFTFSQETLDGGVLRFPASVGVVPPMGGPNGPVTLWVRASVSARVGAPQVELERVVTLRFLRNQRASARVFLPLSCNDPSSGCTSVLAANCTVSVRCREQGATCGDNGDCVRPEVTVAGPDGGEPIDVSISPLDVTSGRGEDVGEDAVIDAAAQDVLSDVVSIEAGVMIAAPRPIYPISTGAVNSRRPQLRWRRPPATGEGVATLCRDRACTRVLETIVGVDTASPTQDLNDGWYFWNVRGKNASSIGTNASVTWQFYVHPAPMGSGFTSTMAPLDVNGDHYTDVVAGVPGAPNGGVARVLLGTAGGLAVPEVELVSPVDGARFGTAVANAGDINGDGFSDIVVGDPMASPGGIPSAGRMSIFFGSAMGLSTMAQTINGTIGRTEFGNAVASAGDINGDGFGDVIVGWHLHAQFAQMNSGSAFVYLGGPMGLVDQVRCNFSALRPDEQMGYAVAGAGDVNRDGYGDVIFSAPNTSNGMVNRGLVVVAHGAADPGAVVFTTLLFGPQPNWRYGLAVASAGDLNGDQYSDIILGMPESSPGGLIQAGSAETYLGGPNGVNMASRAIFAGTVAGDHFGASVGAADINGDGFSDLVVGSPRSAVGGMLTGDFRVYGGSAMGMPSGLGMSDVILMANDQVGTSVAAGDINNDGFAEVLLGGATSGRGMGAGSGYVGVLSFNRLMMPPLRVSGSRVGLTMSAMFGTSLSM